MSLGTFVAFVCFAVISRVREIRGADGVNQRIKQPPVSSGKTDKRGEQRGTIG
jgi:hypothetical protein